MRPLGIRRFLVFSLSLSFLAGAAMLSVPAAAGESRALDLLTQAAKSYDAGDYSNSAQLIDAAFKAGLSGEYAARAILLRAQINERGGALALALQDYSNALWVGSLPEAEKKKAAEGKERVMASMGLSQPAPAASRSVSASARPAPAPQQPSPGGSFGFLDGVFGGSEEKSAAPARPAPEPQQASSGGMFGFFGGVFGGSEEKRAAPAEQPKPPEKQADATPQKAPKPVKPAVDKASSTPKPSPVAGTATVRVASVKRALQPASALSVASGAEGFLIVFGGASSEPSGRATAQQIKAQLSDILVNRQLDVAMRPGRGYQIQAGPYKTKSAAAALCSAIKQRGVSCQVTP